jgi:hypothetical protein
MNLYSLTKAEMDIINEMNDGRSGAIMVVSDFGVAAGLSADDIQKPEYAEYLDALGGYDQSKVVSIDPEQLERDTLLDYNKKAKAKEIDARSAEIITAGVEVVRGKSLSTSTAAYQNLQDLMLANIAGILTFPVSVSTLDGMEYEIKDSKDFGRLVGLIQNMKMTVLGQGRALRMAALRATTQEELDTVVDKR